MCSVISAGPGGRSGADAGDARDGCGVTGVCGIRESRTSISLVMVQPPASTRAIPRAGTSAGMPRRLTATRATPLTDATGSLMDSRPRIRAARRDGVSRICWPIETVPAGSVPVTTVPLPRMLNDLSTHNRTGAAASGAGSDATSRASAARSSGRPAPVTALTGTASTVPRCEPAMRSSA